jgi:hypothetical protein
VFRSLLARRVEALLLPQFRGRLQRVPTSSPTPGRRRLPQAGHPHLADGQRCGVGPQGARQQADTGHRGQRAARWSDEQATLCTEPPRRRSTTSLDRADIPLLDEADALVSGVRATYGHIVVDEAQDLSAMALRMLARRSPDRSMTVLGDLAQSTALRRGRSTGTNVIPAPRLARAPRRHRARDRLSGVAQT